jgi:hypothetical protein
MPPSFCEEKSGICVPQRPTYNTNQPTLCSQSIRNLALNESVVEIGFGHDCSAEFAVSCSAKPAALFAGNMRLNEASLTAGLNPDSNVWVCDQNGHVTTMFADSSSVTLYYGPEPPRFQSSTTIDCLTTNRRCLGSSLPAQKKATKSHKVERADIAQPGSAVSSAEN